MNQSLYIFGGKIISRQVFPCQRVWQYSGAVLLVCSEVCLPQELTVASTYTTAPADSGLVPGTVAIG